MTDYEADMATQRLRISLIDAWQEKWFFHIIGELQTLYLINGRFTNLQTECPEQFIIKSDY